jgi:hypothetical protein
MALIVPVGLACESPPLLRARPPLRALAVGCPLRELTVARAARARLARAQLCGPRCHADHADHVDAAREPGIHRERSTAAGSARSPAAASSLAAARLICAMSLLAPNGPWTPRGLTGVRREILSTACSTYGSCWHRSFPGSRKHWSATRSPAAGVLC